MLFQTVWVINDIEQNAISNSVCVSTYIEQNAISNSVCVSTYIEQNAISNSVGDQRHRTECSFEQSVCEHGRGK